jgi:ABC-2 type transport system ATP-binding protein
MRYHASLHGMACKLAEERIAQGLERVALTDERNTVVRRLSGGQRRRVEIARALIHSPRFLLLDEPTVGLDIASRRSILDHVRALCRDTGLGVLWATHLLDEVESTDQLVIMDKGEVKAIGSVPEILAATSTDQLGLAFSRLVRIEQ